MRTTSLEVYHQIKQEGLLSKMRWLVYEDVFQNGPCTSAQSFKRIIGSNGSRSLTQSRARFTELRDMGAFKELGTTRCPVTGRKAILWDVTSKAPTQLKRETRKSYACEEHHFFVISKDQKNCSAGHESLFPCKIRRVVFK